MRPFTCSTNTYCAPIMCQALGVDCLIKEYLLFALRILERCGISYIQLLQCYLLSHASMLSNTLSPLQRIFPHTHHTYTCTRAHTSIHSLCWDFLFLQLQSKFTYTGKFVSNSLSSDLNVPPPVGHLNALYILSMLLSKHLS